jgi:hypothetical protein
MDLHLFGTANSLKQDYSAALASVDALKHAGKQRNYPIPEQKALVMSWLIIHFPYNYNYQQNYIFITLCLNAPPRRRETPEF